MCAQGRVAAPRSGRRRLELTGRVRQKEHGHASPSGAASASTHGSSAARGMWSPPSSVAVKPACTLSLGILAGLTGPGWLASPTRWEAHGFVPSLSRCWGRLGCQLCVDAVVCPCSPPSVRAPSSRRRKRLQVSAAAASTCKNTGTRAQNGCLSSCLSVGAWPPQPPLLPRRPLRGKPPCRSCPWLWRPWPPLPLLLPFLPWPPWPCLSGGSTARSPTTGAPHSWQRHGPPPAAQRPCLLLGKPACGNATPPTAVRVMAPNHRPEHKAQSRLALFAGPGLRHGGLNTESLFVYFFLSPHVDEGGCGCMRRRGRAVAGA